MKAYNGIIENLSFNRIFSAFKDVAVDIKGHYEYDF